MSELKHKKIEVCFFKMLLTSTGMFIGDEKILDNMLTCANIVLNHSDWSNVKDEDAMAELYNKAFNDSKEYYLKLYEDNKNKSLSDEEIEKIKNTF